MRSLTWTGGGPVTRHAHGGFGGVGGATDDRGSMAARSGPTTTAIAAAAATRRAGHKGPHRPLWGSSPPSRSAATLNGATHDRLAGGLPPAAYPLQPRLRAALRLRAAGRRAAVLQPPVLRRQHPLAMSRFRNVRLAGLRRADRQDKRGQVGGLDYGPLVGWVLVRTCGSVTSAPDASAPPDLVFVPFVGEVGPAAVAPAANA